MRNYTGFATEGAKYDSKLDIKDIAKLVRKEIKEKHPEIKTSVRIERYSMGQSLNVKALNVKVTESSEPLKNPSYDSDLKWALRVGKITEIAHEDQHKLEYMTTKGKEVETSIKDIIGQYNRDDSDGSIDYLNIDC